MLKYLLGLFLIGSLFTPQISRATGCVDHPKRDACWDSGGWVYRARDGSYRFKGNTMIGTHFIEVHAQLTRSPKLKDQPALPDVLRNQLDIAGWDNAIQGNFKVCILEKSVGGEKLQAGCIDKILRQTKIVSRAGQRLELN